MNPVIVKYPLDRSGHNPNNLVPSESHDLPPTTRNRAFVAKHGPFFTAGATLIEGPTGRPLTPGVHYKLVQLYQEASVELGQEVCAIVVVTDATVQSPVLFSYQVLGGPFSSDVSGLLDLIADLDLDDRPVEWGQILGKPNQFPPTPHLHDAGDLYGLEYLCEALERLRQAILIGNEPYMEALRQWVRDQMSEMRQELQKNADDLKAHLQDQNNPHKVTKDQVGLGSVENFGIAGAEDMKAGTSNSLYVTPLGVQVAIDKFAQGTFADHLRDFLNPHKVDKEQVGLGKVENYPVASDVEMEELTSKERYVTPFGLSKALAKWKTTLGNAVDRNFFVSTSLPTNSQGKDGDIWLRYA